MIVVGVGCGPGMLTEEAVEVIRGARHIYTSKRSFELVRSHVLPAAEVHFITDYTKLSSLPDDAVLLSTGDPMLAGLGKHGDRIVPGISSLQVAAARLHLDMAKVSVVDGHGRKDYQENVIDELRRGKVVFLLADPATDLEDLGSKLTVLDIGGRMALCQDLGYPHEEIVCGTISSPPSKTSPMFCVVIGNW
ncbi:cobalt-precorrin-7 (C(5))-methyltransferase [Methanomassiliicoccus luminyensis]|jgi:cobalt-precorrin-7 (C5)-methyltransferase|uniref:cobalt-precorrin-7 (C(5))-methyltransferase n=1 Tax=Methanomassiliicoccus luminyensis TaxID=1080712 RepID=UPI00037C9739|nr:cobalt-precorrin-7 (C(5))-methyltransferase [Methanomassiliicoccus luminyensis]